MSSMPTWRTQRMHNWQMHETDATRIIGPESQSLFAPMYMIVRLMPP